MFRISYDLVGPLQNAISRSRGAWEVTGEVDLNNLFVIGAFGNEHFDYGDSSYHYRSDGNYNRIGFDLNMIPRDEYDSELFFGFRYATSRFQESLSGERNIFQWGKGYFNEQNTDMKATWIEFTAGMKAKVWKNLFMGYTLRLKIKMGVQGEQNLETYRIPGYGLAEDNNFWGINYYAAWRFNFAQKYVRPSKFQKE